jgi:hypothetical protein
MSEEDKTAYEKAMEKAGSDEARPKTPVAFLDAFRFSVRIGKRRVALSKVSGIDMVTSAKGSKRILPVVLEAAVKAGELGLVQFCEGTARHPVYIDELTKDGGVGRTLFLGNALFEHYELAAHDACAPLLLFEHVTIRPEKVQAHAGQVFQKESGS